MQEMQETQSQSLGQKDPLVKKMATYFSILAWRIPWTEEPGGLQSMGSKRVGHNLVTKTTVLAEDNCCVWQLLFMVPCGLQGLSWVTYMEVPRDW